MRQWVTRVFAVDLILRGITGDIFYAAYEENELGQQKENSLARNCCPHSAGNRIVVIPRARARGFQPSFAVERVEGKFGRAVP